MRHKIIAVLSTLAALAQAADAKTYWNPEYGFAVELPPGLPTCEGPVGQIERGVAVFLDSGADGCARVAGRPLVGLFGRYNAGRQPSAEAELRRACALRPGTQLPAPPDLEIGDLDSAACRVNRPDGWIDILVVAQAGERPAVLAEPTSGAVAEAAPFINYTALLHTHIRRLDRDMEMLRLLLDRVKVDKRLIQKD